MKRLEFATLSAALVAAPGWGQNFDDLAEWLDMLKATRLSVQSLIDQGMSDNEAWAARPTAAFDISYSAGCFMNPENYTRLLYQSLTRN